MGAPARRFPLTFTLLQERRCRKVEEESRRATDQAASSQHAGDVIELVAHGLDVRGLARKGAVH